MDPNSPTGPGGSLEVPPAWLDRTEYPFDSHWFQTGSGRMHFVDEGQGRPVVFVHGNPTWSFQFRKVIKELRTTRRCIAPDHLGFGLSDKPPAFSYLPADQARNFSEFMESLDLADVTLVVGDWGGPIGLSWALDNPERVSSVVITNTWLWSVRSDWYYRAFGGFVGGPIGRQLIRHRNFFAATVLPAAYGDRARLTPEIHRQYLAPLATGDDRRGSWVLPGQIIGSSDWLAALWDRREALAEKRIVIAWGMKDIAFRAKEMRRWQEAFPGARSVQFPHCGHYVAEEQPVELAQEISRL